MLGFMMAIGELYTNIARSTGVFVCITVLISMENITVSLLRACAYVCVRVCAFN